MRRGTQAVLTLLALSALLCLTQIIQHYACFPVEKVVSVDDKGVRRDVGARAEGRTGLFQMHLMGVPSDKAIVFERIDDCLMTAYLDGQLIHEEKFCRPSMHCGGLTLKLPEGVSPGPHVLTFTIQNKWGRTGFHILRGAGVKGAPTPWPELVLLTATILVTILTLCMEYGGYGSVPSKVWDGFSGNPIIALGILAGVSWIFLLPIFDDLARLGINDWDQETFYLAVPAHTLLKSHQIPLWNPYQCGGNVMLANPQSGFLSPLFPLILLFGEVAGAKILVLASFILGSVGCYLLAREMGYKPIASYAVPLVFMFSGSLTMHLVEGHIIWSATAWLPWVFLLYLRSFEDIRHCLPSGLALTFIFFSGHAYLYTYTILFLSAYSFCRSAQLNSRKPFTVLALVLACSLLFSSVKMVPLMEFQSQHPRAVVDDSGYDWSILRFALLDGGQGFRPTSMLGHVRGIWHEYGAYVGAAAIACSILGVLLRWRRMLPLLLVALFFLNLSFSQNSPVNMWGDISRLPGLKSLRNPNRMIILVVFSISLFAGAGLTFVEGKSRLLAALIIVAVFADMMVHVSPVWGLAFTVTPPADVEADSVFTQGRSQNHTLPSYSTMYLQYLSNRGTLDCYEQVHLPVAARASSDLDYLGEAFMEEGFGTAHVVDFTPNRVAVAVNAKRAGRLMLNQNYYTGWRVVGEGHSAGQYLGLVSTNVSAGAHTITFQYLPASFIAGALTTIISLLAASYLYVRAGILDRLL